MVGAKKQSNLITYIILIAGLLLIILPLYITLVTAFKSNEQSSVSYFTLPNPVYLDSFKEILSSERYYMARKKASPLILRLSRRDSMTASTTVKKIKRMVYWKVNTSEL